MARGLGVVDAMFGVEVLSGDDLDPAAELVEPVVGAAGELVFQAAPSDLRRRWRDGRCDGRLWRFGRGRLLKHRR